jgi:hypothetical protein
MNLISDILFWISNGLLVPVVVLLIILFIRSLLLIGSFFGQYLAIRRTDALLRQQLDTLTIDTLPELEGKLPVKSNSLVIAYIRRVLESKDQRVRLHRKFAFQFGQSIYSQCIKLLTQQRIRTPNSQILPEKTAYQ